MTTRLIGIKEFRQNLTKFSKQKNLRLIVMNHMVPVFKVEPIDEDALILERFGKDIELSLEEARRGDVVPLEQIMADVRKKRR